MSISLFEIIVIVMFISFVCGMALIPLFSLFDETETFAAIDKKIAEMIRGKEGKKHDRQMPEE